MLGNTNAITPNQNLSISLNGANTVTYNGSVAKSLNITASLVGAATTSHNHDSVYAKTSHTHTKSQITDFPASLKNPTALTISLNGTSQGAYDGSAAKSINVTAASIGAAASSHTHNYAGSSSAGGNANAAVKLATARKIGNASFNGTADITVAAIGAAAASHNHDSVYAKTSHTHSYLPLSGGQMTGELNMQNKHLRWNAATDYAIFHFEGINDDGNMFITLGDDLSPSMIIRWWNWENDIYSVRLRIFYNGIKVENGANYYTDSQLGLITAVQSAAPSTRTLWAW